MADGIFGRYPPAKWEVPGAAAVVFPVERLEQIGGNRLVPHERLHRDGARLDDTGSKAEGWSFTISFYNSNNHEEGVKGLEQYPDTINALIDACRIHETGTLTVPTVGKRRCRAESWRRVESYDKVDMAAVVITWLEDNEDDAESAAAQFPSASAVASKYAKDANAAAEEFGTTSLDDLEAFADDLGDMLSAPSEFAADIDAKVGNLTAAGERLQATVDTQATMAKEELETIATDPLNGRALRAIAKVLDVAHRAPIQKHDKQGTPIVTRTFDVDLSIFGVAQSVGQSPGKLIPLNAGLADLLHIPAGTPVRVYAKGG